MVTSLEELGFERVRREYTSQCGLLTEIVTASIS